MDLDHSDHEITYFALDVVFETVFRVQEADILLHFAWLERR
jgi:hypothetical protein